MELSSEHDLEEYLSERSGGPLLESPSHAVRYCATEYFAVYSEADLVLDMDTEDLDPDQFSKWLVGGTNDEKPSVTRDLMETIYHRAQKIAEIETEEASQ